jgi:hypothetical protein
MDSRRSLSSLPPSLVAGRSLPLLGGVSARRVFLLPSLDLRFAAGFSDADVAVKNEEFAAFKNEVGNTRRNC